MGGKKQLAFKLKIVLYVTAFGPILWQFISETHSLNHIFIIVIIRALYDFWSSVMAVLVNNSKKLHMIMSPIFWGNAFISICKYIFWKHL